MSSQQAPLQFAPLSSSLSPTFWQSLTSLKLNVLKLSDSPVNVGASYRRSRTVKDRLTGEQVGLGCEIMVETEGLGTDSSSASPSSYSDRVLLNGQLRNFNTIEEFKNCDKTALLDQLGEQIWQRIITHPESVTASNLNPFLIITFADLKKYRYWYWCAFPALLMKPAWEVDIEWSDLDESQQTLADEQSYLEPFRLAKKVEGQDSYLFASITDASRFFEGVPTSERYLVFSDPSSHSTAIGWSTRNVLTYLAVAHSLTSLRLISIRETSIRTVSVSIPSSPSSSAPRPSVIGWEKNDKKKLGPRLADLAPLMDPIKLADQAVDLNLQLMRWRILPELDLEKIKNTKILLLGAGTLGCYVARTLIAWGVRKITFVDSSTVSFSNPVRQPLFEFDDSLQGGKPKAETAAKALKRIYPGVDANGISLSIPMPGHPIPPQLREQTKKDVEVLEKLIEEHDVVYLLMDSRESRWLPTVIGASKQKLVMNVALGFDTFLVMRHGISSKDPCAVLIPVQPGSPYRGQLGCYYCNDIVAPMDSLTDRTLDQMCTVTRPGIASIASSTAVELMVSTLQHPFGSLAPSIIPSSSTSNNQSSSDHHQERKGNGVEEEEGCCLGIVPHQIRGFLSRFENLKITGQAYDKCTGCSRFVIEAYENQGFDMLSQAFEDAKYLERLTGLDKLEEETQRMMEGMEEWDGEDDESQEGGDDDF